ncbi:MAG: hypothetical protein LUG51_13795 [Tannerellaceae bacterium]|nr:hypothetical protein [Tannerellaceae bacterium]
MISTRAWACPDTPLGPGAYTQYTHVHMYGNTDYKKLMDVYAARNTSPHKYNVEKRDKLSSFILHASNNSTGNWLLEITLYDLWDWKGLSITIAGEAPELAVPNLKKYPLYPGSSKNWNDEAASFTFY